VAADRVVAVPWSAAMVVAADAASVAAVDIEVPPADLAVGLAEQAATRTTSATGSKARLFSEVHSPVTRPR
jgi:hypothetical protein